MKKLFQITATMAAVVLMSFTAKELTTWNTDVIDAGTIPVNKPKTFEFVVTNKSDKDLLITSVRASCGCTASDYSKEAIAPGKSGFVKAIYNAAAKGSFTKNITVNTSVEETAKILTLKGIVE